MLPPDADTGCRKRRGPGRAPTRSRPRNQILLIAFTVQTVPGMCLISPWRVTPRSSPAIMLRAQCSTTPSPVLCTSSSRPPTVLRYFSTTALPCDGIRCNSGRKPARLCRALVLRVRCLHGI
eukprot:3933829-Rhodomonas_salina.1